MVQFENFINGDHVPPASARYMDTDNPFTGQAWAKIARSNAADAEVAVGAARCAFTEGPWAEMTAVERAAMLRRLGDAVVGNVEKLARAEVTDNGKTITEMRGQMRNVAEWFYYYGALADKFAGEVLHTERKNHLNYTRYEPLGVVAAITPWNSPVRLLSWKLAPALAVGNTVVVKPSEFASTSTIAFVELLTEAGLPRGVVNVVTGLGSEVGEALVSHPHVAKIAFTGGPAGGAAVYEAAARHIKPVALELGGKSANIVFADADLERAAIGAVTAIFGSYGQSCVAGSRLLLDARIDEDTFLKRMLDVVGKIRFGDPMDPDTEVGPVANRQQFEKIQSYVEVAQSQGARLICGGKPLLRPDIKGGLFIEPTIVAGVRNDMRIAQEEVFGPILSVIRFENEADAIRIANDTEYGLAAGIWSRDVNRVHRVAAKLEAGSVWVNTYRVTSQLSPFGGFKKSGIGREGGAEMLKSYMQTKSIWIDLNEDFKSPFKG